MDSERERYRQSGAKQFLWNFILSQKQIRKLNEGYVNFVSNIFGKLYFISYFFTTCFPASVFGTCCDTMKLLFLLTQPRYSLAFSQELRISGGFQRLKPVPRCAIQLAFL